MKTLSIREMRNTLGQLESLVLNSGELIITRHGTPIARVLPIEGRKPKPTHAALRQKMAPLAQPSEELIAAERDDR